MAGANVEAVMHFKNKRRSKGTVNEMEITAHQLKQEISQICLQLVETVENVTQVECE